MQKAIELFIHTVQSQAPFREGVTQTYWVGSELVSRVVNQLHLDGWKATFHDPASRLEFLSLSRESHAGVFIEKIPDDWDGVRVQRLLASLFSAIHPGGVVFLGYEKLEDMAILAWFRQAGFEALQQGFSGSLKATLARRIGGVPSRITSAHSRTDDVAEDWNDLAKGSHSGSSSTH